jgi:hypothetical protein
VPVPEDSDDAGEQRVMNQTPKSAARSASSLASASGAALQPPMDQVAERALLNRALSHFTLGFALLHELKSSLDARRV